MRTLDILCLAPEGFYIFGLLMLVLFGSFKSYAYNNTNIPYVFKNTRLAYLILLGLYGILLFVRDRYDALFCFSLFQITPAVSLWLQLLNVLFISTVLFTFKLPQQYKSFELIILFALIHIGMMHMLLSNHFLTLYLSLELQTLTIYIIMALNKKVSFVLEATLKYIILSTLAGGAYLFGVILIYLTTGSFYFSDLQLLHLEDTSLLVIYTAGALSIMIVFLFKLAIVPFHMALPIVYSSIPIITVFILATASKFVNFMTLSYLVTTIFSSIFPMLSMYLLTVALSSLVLATIAAIIQTTFFRFYAYSSIVHMALIITLLSIGSPLATCSSVVYLAIYLILTMHLFFNLGTLNQKVDFKSLTITEFIKLSLSPSIVLLLFSFGGVPPLLGFWGKSMVLYSLLVNGQILILFLAIITSIASTYYYLRLIIYSIQPFFLYLWYSRTTYILMTFGTSIFWISIALFSSIELFLDEVAPKVVRYIPESVARTFPQQYTKIIAGEGPPPVSPYGTWTRDFSYDYASRPETNEFGFQIVRKRPTTSVERCYYIDSWAELFTGVPSSPSSQYHCIGVYVGVPNGMSAWFFHFDQDIIILSNKDYQRLLNGLPLSAEALARTVEKVIELSS